MGLFKKKMHPKNKLCPGCPPQQNELELEGLPEYKFKAPSAPTSQKIQVVNQHKQRTDTRKKTLF